jgi:hypothetical protein
MILRPGTGATDKQVMTTSTTGEGIESRQSRYDARSLNKVASGVFDPGLSGCESLGLTNVGETIVAGLLNSVHRLYGQIESEDVLTSIT